MIALHSSWLVLLIACGGFDANIPVQNVPLAFRGPVPLAVAGRVGFDPYWSHQAQALIDATTAVIESPRFHDVVLSHPGLHVSPAGPEIDPKVLLAAYLGSEANGRHMVPAALYMRELSKATRGTTVIRGAQATMCIRPDVLRQWASGSVVVQACAVNTLAHELTHTVADPGSTASLFTDSGARAWLHRWISGPADLVSYGVGTLAECTYLEQMGDASRDAFEDCVAKRSLSTFVGCPSPSGEDTLGELVDNAGC